MENVHFRSLSFDIGWPCASTGVSQPDPINGFLALRASGKPPLSRDGRPVMGCPGVPAKSPGYRIA
jgi:hypothetical protein